MAKLVPVTRLLATAALWFRIQTSLKNTKSATLAKEWPPHSSPPKIITTTKPVLKIGDRDPVVFWLREPGWKTIRIRDTRSGINIPDDISKSLVQFFGLEIVKFFVSLVFLIRIQCFFTSESGIWDKKIWIHNLGYTSRISTSGSSNRLRLGNGSVEPLSDSWIYFCFYSGFGFPMIA